MTMFGEGAGALDSVSTCINLRHKIGMTSEQERASARAATSVSTSGGRSSSMLASAQAANPWLDIMEREHKL